ncbi:HAMP domain-containing protein [Streptomyces avermitilis]|nr:HAMP domain-containing protein [Streptomyces avermitilis]
MVTGRAHRIWGALALAGACVLAAVALVAFTLARRITRPLRTLERATTQLAAGRLDNPPDAESGPPELRRLAAAFTHTATRLQHLSDGHCRATGTTARRGRNREPRLRSAGRP